LTVIALDALMASFTDDELAKGAGVILFILLPFIAVPFTAMLVGIVLSIFLWKHWPLIIIAGSSVLLAAVNFTGFGSPAFQKAVPLVYGIGVAAMCGVWFLFLRRRPFPPDVKE
jgi:hypothetical protein